MLGGFMEDTFSFFLFQNKDLNHNDRNSSLAEEVTNFLPKELWEKIKLGEVIAEKETEGYFRLLGKYPLGINRIDWNGVKNVISFDVLPLSNSEIGIAAEREKLLSLSNDILNIFKTNNIGISEPIIWVGDDTEFSLHMTVGIFLQIFHLLFPTPQHHYIINQAGDWCMNYTMEGQLFFGLLINVKKSNQADF